MTRIRRPWSKPVGEERAYYGELKRFVNPNRDLPSGFFVTPPDVLFEG